MLNLAEGLLERGLRVDLVLVRARGELLESVPANARVVDLNVSHSVLALPGLVRYLRREKPVAVLASQTHLNVVAIWARALSGVPHRVVISEHIDPAEAARHAQNWKDSLLPVMARLFYGRADQVVVVSQAAAGPLLQATGLPAHRLRVIHNPVVTRALLAQAQRPLDHPWFLPDQPPVILSAGRLTRQKDHATLLHAFAIVRKETAARLVILGEGEERQALESLARELKIEDELSLPGFVPNPFALMAGARVFVLCSRWEGLPTVLVEALACGTPVVSTDCPSGPAEILGDGRYGLLTPPGDARALAAGILKSLRRPPPTHSLKSRALQFSVERILPQYLDVLLPS